MAILLKNGRVLDGRNHLVPMDVLIVGDTIQALGQDLDEQLDPTDLTIEDLNGQFLAPGFVDLHVHYRDPGLTEKETVETGSAAAARGGFTTVCAMPNTKPVPDTVDTFKAMQARNTEDAKIHVEQYAPITKVLTSEELTDIAALAEAGAVSFTNGGVGVQTAGTMYEAMQAVAAVDGILTAHTEDNSLLYGGVMHAGKKNKDANLPGMLGLTESTQIARDVLLAEATGVHYHVCHVSTKESVRVIKDAKRAGIHVTCEVTPHHLLLTEDDVDPKNANYKMNPPLRSRADREALRAGLLDGTIDCIATDHAPHTDTDKAAGFLKAPFGIIGSETCFPMLYTHLVKEGLMTLQDLVDHLTCRPAACFNLPGGKLAVGQPADLTVIALDQTETLTDDYFASKSRNTPWLGETVHSRIEGTMCAGQWVFKR